MRNLFILSVLVIAPILGLILFFGKSSYVEIAPVETAPVETAPEKSSDAKPALPIAIPKNPYGDIGPQKPMANPPSIINAVYLTGWSAGNRAKISNILSLASRGLINSVVIDIKDYSGYVGYDIELPDVNKYGAKRIKIPRINALLKTLHDNNIYAIARLTVFQDPALARARPDLAVHSKAKMGTSTAPLHIFSLWKDRKGLSWIDPVSQEAWKYNIDIAKDALARGFDEINFDYIRFPTDGLLDDMYFRHWDGKTPRHTVIRSFFKYMRDELGEAKTSADLFGLTTINRDDLGIGQVIEDAYMYFDFVSPMIYPSHYAPGFLGYKNPALHPYEVVKHSLDNAVLRLYGGDIATSSMPDIETSPVVGEKYKKFRAELRPWLQDFNLGAIYTAEMVQKQIQAVKDSLGARYRGFMLWNASNVYTNNVQP